MLGIAIDLHRHVEIVVARILEAGLNGTANAEVVREVDDIRSGRFRNGPGPVGTGSGDKVTAGVTFQPWLVSANLNGPCAGGNVVTNKNQCMNNGWKTSVRADNTPFKNQGDCVSYASNGK